MNTVVGSVVYYAAIEYLQDFLDSLECQSDKDFTLLLINDDIPEDRLLTMISAYSFFERTRIISLLQTLEPYQLRIELIKEAKKKHDLLILIDCDDVMSSTRVEKYKSDIEDGITFYYNKLLDFSNAEVMPDLPIYTNGIELIAEKNYLGLTNTALWLPDITEKFLDSLYVGKTKIFDWYLFSRLILEGKRGKLVKECHTKYRVYEGNLAGQVSFSEKMVRKEIDIKRGHYTLLKNELPLFKELADIYGSISEENVKCEKRDLYFWWGMINMLTKSENK